MAQIAYVDWDGLVYYDGKIKQYISDVSEINLKAGGEISFTSLPRPSYQNLNYVYKITDEFTSTDDFEIPGYKYAAGTVILCADFTNDKTYRYSILTEPSRTEEFREGIDNLNSRVGTLEEITTEHSTAITSATEAIEELSETVINQYAKKSEIPSIKGLATESYVDSLIADANVRIDETILDVSDLNTRASGLETRVTTTEAQVEGMLTSSIASLNTSVDLLNKALDNKADIKDIPSLEGYAKTADVVRDYETIAGAQNKLLEAKAYTDAQVKAIFGGEVDDAYNSFKEIQDLLKDDDKATESLIKSVNKNTADISDLYNNKANVEHTHRVEDITNAPDFDSFAKYDDLTEYAKIADVESIVEEVIEGGVEINLNNYYNKDETDSLLSGFYTKEETYSRDEVNQLIPDVSGFATQVNVDSELTAIDKRIDELNTDLNEIGGRALNHEEAITNISAQVVTISNQLPTFITDDELSLAMPKKVSDLENDLKYITQVDIVNKADKGTTLAGYGITDTYTKTEVDAKLLLLEGGGSIDETTLAGFVSEDEWNVRINNYATKAELDNKASIIHKHSISDVDGYENIIPTKISAFDNDKGYITEQNLTGYAKVEDIPSLDGYAKADDIPSLEGYAKVDDIPNVSKFITAEDVSSYIPETYVTNDELTEALETINIDDYAKKEDIPTDYLTQNDLDGYSKFSGSYNDLTDKPEIPSVDGLASTTYVDNKLAEIKISTKVSELENDVGYITAKDIPENLSNYYTKTEVNNLIPSDYLTSDALLDYAKTEDIPNVANFITMEDVELQGYLTQEDISGKAEAEHTHRLSDIEDYEAPNLNDYVLESELPDFSKFLTEVPDEYLTEEELSNKGFITEQSLEHLATKELVSTEIAKLSDDIRALDSAIGYAATDDRTFAEVIDDNFAKKTEVDNSIDVLQQWVIDQDYLTQHQDISGKANNVLFTEDYFVGNALGNFQVGDSVKDMPIREILINLLGLSTESVNPDEPDTPETKDSITVEDILPNSIPVVSGSSKNGLLETSAFSAVEFKTANEYNALPTDDFKTDGNMFYYEYVDESGNVIEHGYQTYTGITGKSNYYQVAIPNGLTLVKVMVDGLNWATYEEPTGSFTIVEQVVIDGYTYNIYQDSRVGTGQCYRFIVE